MRFQRRFSISVSLNRFWTMDTHSFTELASYFVIRTSFMQPEPTNPNIHLIRYKKLDDTGIEPGTSHMLSECDNQLHQTPWIYLLFFSTNIVVNTYKYTALSFIFRLSKWVKKTKLWNQATISGFPSWKQY